MVSGICGTRLDVRALLRALEDGWQGYLPTVRALDAADMKDYLAAQGYERLRDLLAHATAWSEETLGVVPVLLRGEAIQRYDDQSDPAFNAQAIARFSLLSGEEVERRFVEAHAALARLLARLPDAALTEDNVYDWLATTIVGHFNEHRPPNMPALA
jgi:hypothetical protein